MVMFKKMFALLLVAALLSAVPFGAFAIDCGDVVTFGTFKQNRAAEPIEWEVLNVYGDTAVLISKYILDCRPVDEDGVSKWKRTDLCMWLEEVFSSNFEYSEYRYLLPNEFGDMVGIPTLADVTDPEFGFSPSQDAHDMSRAASGTKYAKNRNLWVNDDNGYSTYYTCTNYSKNKGTFCTVRSDGAIGYARPDRDNVGVRVLIYVDVEAFDGYYADDFGGDNG